jgi:hypothetical protein
MTVGITGTINYTAYETFADVFNHDPQSVSTQISALASKTANTSANCSVSATGTFVLVNSVTATATLTVYLNQGTSATG